jgi:Flp pilus assembly protein TadG
MCSERRGLLACDAGAAAVEFGLVCLIFATLLLGTIQFGFTFWEYVQVAQAARIGARWAALGQTSQVTARAQAAAPGLDPGRMSVSIGGGSSADSVRVTVSYPTTIFAPLPGIGLMPAQISSSSEQREE